MNNLGGAMGGGQQQAHPGGMMGMANELRSDIQTKNYGELARDGYAAYNEFEGRPTRGQMTGMPQAGGAQMGANTMSGGNTAMGNSGMGTTPQPGGAMSQSGGAMPQSGGAMPQSGGMQQEGGIAGLMEKAKGLFGK